MQTERIRRRPRSICTFLIVLPFLALSPTASRAADDVDALRRELEAQKARSQKQDQTIQKQQEQLEEQQNELERLDRKLDEMTAAETPEKVPAATAKDEETRIRVSRDEVGDLNREAIEVGDFPGSFKIPGPRGISLAIGGFIKAEAIYDSNAENTGADFLPATLGTRRSDDDGAFSIDATLTRLHLDGRVPTDLGNLRGYVEWDLNGGNDGSLEVKWRLAYATWATEHGTLLVGQGWSTMMDLKILPESLTEPTASGLIFTRQPIIRWTQPIGSSFFVHLAVEDPNNSDVFTDNPQPDFFNANVPDFVVGVEYVRERQGHLRLNGIVRYPETKVPGFGTSHAVGWGLALTGHLDVLERDRAMFSTVYGEGLGRYLLGIQPNAGARISNGGDLQARENWGAQVAYEHHWNDVLRSTAMFGYAHAKSDRDDPDGFFEKSAYASGNLVWSVLPYLNVGVEYIYGLRENNDDSDIDNHRAVVGFQLF